MVRTLRRTSLHQQTTEESRLSIAYPAPIIGACQYTATSRGVSGRQTIWLKQPQNIVPHSWKIAATYLQYLRYLPA